MDHINYARKYLKEFLEKTTMAFEDSINKGDPELKQYAPAYVYFTKLYFEFCAEAKYLEYAKKYKEKAEYDKLNNLINDLNNTSKAITNLTSIKYTPIKVIKIGSNEHFYLQHKAKLENFTIMPKDKKTENKIIKTLELWTGRKGRDAVIKTMDRLIVDSNYLFDYIINLHNTADITNKKISARYQLFLHNLLNYYLRHKKKYCPSRESKSITLSDGIKIKLKDEFVDINIKFKYCDFPSYTIAVRNFIEGITKIDIKAIINFINLSELNIQEFISAETITDEQIITQLKYRKNIKTRILEILDEIKEDLDCYELNVKYEFDEKKYTGDSIPMLLSLIRKFLEVEEIAEKEIKLIKENMETQYNNINMLIDAAEELTGPSTAPCIMRMLPAIKYLLTKRNLFTKKGKVSPAGESLIKSLL